MNEPRYMDATTFQRNIGSAIHDVQVRRDTIIVTSHGRAQVVVVDVTLYDELIAMRRRQKEAAVDR